MRAASSVKGTTVICRLAVYCSTARHPTPQGTLVLGFGSSPRLRANMNYKHWETLFSGRNESEQQALEALLGLLLSKETGHLATLRGWSKSGASSRAKDCIKRIVDHADKLRDT